MFFSCFSVCSSYNTLPDSTSTAVLRLLFTVTTCSSIPQPQCRTRVMSQSTADKKEWKASVKAFVKQQRAQNVNIWSWSVKKFAQELAEDLELPIDAVESRKTHIKEILSRIQQKLSKNFACSFRERGCSQLLTWKKFTIKPEELKSFFPCCTGTGLLGSLLTLAMYE